MDVVRFQKTYLRTGRWAVLIPAMIKAGLPVGGGWPGAPRVEDVGRYWKMLEPMAQNS